MSMVENTADVESLDTETSCALDGNSTCEGEINTAAISMTESMMEKSEEVESSPQVIA